MPRGGASRDLVQGMTNAELDQKLDEIQALIRKGTEEIELSLYNAYTSAKSGGSGYLGLYRGEHIYMIVGSPSKAQREMP